MCFGKNIYTNHVLAAKILAIMEALIIVKVNQYYRAIIYSDCQGDVDIVLQKVFSDAHSNMINTCRLWHKKFLEIQINHYNRSFNKATDVVVKACRSSDMDYVVTRIFPSPLI